MVVNMKCKFAFYFLILCIALVKAKFIPDFYEDQWKQFKIDFHKNYRSEAEEIHRREIFVRNVQQINKHNEQLDGEKVLNTRGNNQFADMDDDEMPNPNWSMYDTDSPMYMELPRIFDWRNKSAVTKVKDQGECYNGDWAFAATAALESQLLKNGERLVEDLSAEELLDCSNKGSYGCEGGSVKSAFRYISKNGISTEKSYPHIKQGKACPNNLKNKIGKGWNITCEAVTPMKEETMKQWLVKYGPLLAMIDNSEGSFENYTGGVYQDKNCSKVGNHNVLIVGYGETTDTKQKYWIVKNSWGEKWGEKGYIRIAREDDNVCGIATNATAIHYKKNMA